MNPLKLSLPLGIGDVHWVCTKLRALKARTGRPLHVYVNQSPHHKSDGYLRLVPFVDHVEVAGDAVFDVNIEMPPSHRDPRWSHLETCGPWRRFDYCLVANGHLESGHPLHTWLPDLETEYCYDLNIPTQARDYAASLAPRGTILLYPSGLAANAGFHLNTWTAQHWCEVIRLLNDAGLVPALIGANTTDDLTVAEQIMAELGRARVLNLVGRTDLPSVCALIDQAGAWCGLNSGTGIYAAMRQVPTLMLWSDDRYWLGNGHQMLNHKMQRSWLNEAQLATYRTLSYGAPELSPSAVAGHLLDMTRGAAA